MERLAEFRAGKAGVYPGVPDQEYFALEAVNASTLKRMKRGAKAVAWAKKNPSPPSPQMKLGTALHTVVLEGEPTFLERYLICSGGKNILKKEQQQADEEGKEAITKANVDRVWHMRDSVFAGQFSGPLIQDAQHKECALVWYEPNPLGEDYPPLRCKSKDDAISGDFLIDLKTTSTDNDRDWWKSVYHFGYHIQAAHYLDGANQLTRTVENGYGYFMFVTVETMPPYKCHVFALSTLRNGQGKQTIDMGRMHKARLMKHYAYCLEHGFEDPEQTIEYGEMPRWAFDNAEEPFLWEQEQ